MTTDRVAINGHITDSAGVCRTCPDSHVLLPDCIQPSSTQPEPDITEVRSTLTAGSLTVGGQVQITTVVSFSDGSTRQTMMAGEYLGDRIPGARCDPGYHYLRGTITTPDGRTSRVQHLGVPQRELIT
jgi:hypothetical protein